MVALDIQKEILSSALEISYETQDVSGVLQSSQELFLLFPDLLPDRKRQDEEARDFYKLLKLERHAPRSKVSENYFRAAKKFLRSSNVKERRQEYFAILNAGVVLTNRRLRLSHNLVIARDLLIRNELFDHESPTLADKLRSFNRAPGNIKQLPVLLALLKRTAVLSPLEVQAIENQMRMSPTDSVEELLLSAGYVTAKQITWLTAMLVKNKNNTSLSNWPEYPDWPFGGGPSPGPGRPDSDPFDPSRVPRRPLPSSSAGEIKLPLPAPPQTDT